MLSLDVSEVVEGRHIGACKWKLAARQALARFSAIEAKGHSCELGECAQEDLS